MPAGGTADTVGPNTIQVWSDLGCPWAHVAVHRLHQARRRLRLSEAVTFEHRAFPLELFNSEPTPRPLVTSEIGACAPLAPQAGWQAWQAPDWAWPGTMLPPMEAVRAAGEQGPAAAEELDRELRRAFFGESRCISLRHVILEVAAACEAVELEPLAEAIDSGRARRAVIEDWRRAGSLGVRGSPHLFLPDGGDAHNPGIRFHWQGEPGAGVPVIDEDDPSVYEALVRRAAS
jgi:predicted DsbA family dithiol-disulfide isomerase